MGVAGRTDSAASRLSWRDWIAAAAIAAGGFAAFYIGGNVEFEGDDAYSVVMRAAGIANTFRGEGSFGRQIVDFIINLDANLIDLRHGSIPLLYQGIALRLMDALGVPFSVRTTIIPFAAAAAINGAMLFLFLRQAGLRHLTSAAGAAMMIASPIYAMGARTAAAYFMAAPVFTTLICLLALARPVETTGRRWLLSFALANLILGDTLFFLSGSALIAAWLMTGLGRGGPSLDLRRWMEGMRVFLHPIVAVPNAILLGMVVQSAFEHFRQGPDRFRLIRLGSIVRHHSDVEGVLSDPVGTWSYLAVLVGEAMPAVLLVLVGWILVRRPPVRLTFPLAFGIIAGAGFLVVFYGLASVGSATKNFYQVYVLLPLVIVFAQMLDIVLRAAEGRSGRVAVAALAGAAVVSAAGGQAALVWRVPTLVFSPANFADVVHGMNHPNHGGKALGFLIREILAAEKAVGRTGPVRALVVDGPPVWGTSTSLRVHAGIQSDMAKNSALPFAVAVETFPRDGRLWTERGCDGDLCAILGPAEADAAAAEGARTYRVTDRRPGEPGRIAATLVVLGDLDTSRLPGADALGLTQLDNAFDVRYRAFGDLLPFGPYNNN